MDSVLTWDPEHPVQAGRKLRTHNHIIRVHSTYLIDACHGWNDSMQNITKVTKMCADGLCEGVQRFLAHGTLIIIRSPVCLRVPEAEETKSFV